MQRDGPCSLQATNNIRRCRMSPAATGIRQISVVILPTTDQDQAIAFYESLGFEKRTDIPFGGKYRWVEVYPPEGATGIALAPPQPGSDVQPQDTGIALTTDDVDAQVVRMGDPVPPMCWLRDSSGHRLMVVERR